MLRFSDKHTHTVFRRKLSQIIPLHFRGAWPDGAAAYIIKREAAKRLLEEPEDTHSHVDHFIFNSSFRVAKKYKTYQFSPACCIQDKNDENIVRKNFLSEIETVDLPNLYDNKNVFIRFIKKTGVRLQLRKPFRKLRRSIYKTFGY